MKGQGMGDAEKLGGQVGNMDHRLTIGFRPGASHPSFPLQYKNVIINEKVAKHPTGPWRSDIRHCAGVVARHSNPSSA
jgi:hypothetical protein